MESRRGGARLKRRQRNGSKEGRTPIWAVSSKMLAFYLVVFWLLCAAGAALMIRSQALAPADGDLGNAALAMLIGVGAVGLGAAMTSLILTLAVEAIMVLAQMLKQRQYEQGYEEGVEDGVEIGVERGVAQGREEGVEIGREEGVEIGVERGIAQGREEGVEIGVAQGREEGVEIGVERGVEIGVERGVEIGVERGIAQGREETRQQYNARIRAWAKERGIPAADLPKLDEPPAR